MPPFKNKYRNLLDQRNYSDPATFQLARRVVVQFGSTTPGVGADLRVCPLGRATNRVGPAKKFGKLNHYRQAPFLDKPDHSG
jgi:hypothetical protein